MKGNVSKTESGKYEEKKDKFDIGCTTFVAV